jgi:hypothetical protein
MSRYTVVVLIAVVGCGLPEISGDQQQKSSKAALEKQVNAFALAILDRDAKALKLLVSKELAVEAEARASSVEGGMVADLESQRLGLLAQFGEEKIRKEGFRVEDVAQVEGNQVAVEISIGGEKIPKPMFFEYQDGTYVFSGAFGNQSAAAKVASSAKNYYNWNFHWANNYAYIRNFICGSPGVMTIYPASNNYYSCLAYQCTWFGSTCTEMTLSGQGVAYCTYQVIGIDGSWDTNGVFHCFGL